MSILTTDAVRTHLNITGYDHDDELAGFIEAAEAVVAQYVGPLTPTATTSRVVGGREALVLPVSPVVSLTSVTPTGGTVLDLLDLTLDASAGMISNVSGGWFGYGTYDVIYVAGRSTLPADLALAVKELVRHLWESQRSPARFPGSTISEGPVTVAGAAYLLPFRVQELIAPHRQFGFA